MRAETVAPVKGLGAIGAPDARALVEPDFGELMDVPQR